MPFWVRPYKTRRSTRILSLAVKQNMTLLEVGGEACYLLQRKSRYGTTFQKSARSVSTITETASAGSYSVDPDTGYMRYCLWSATTDRGTSYPDIGTLTATVQASATTSVWESAVDKYSFIEDRSEYAFDLYQDEMTNEGVAIPDAAYVVFNTPPFTSTNTSIFNFGTINPKVNFSGMQPVVDDGDGFQRSLFGFDQWRKSNSKIRSRNKPNAFLLAFPGVQSDFVITDGGLLRETRSDFWTVPPPYSPQVAEHDIVIRSATSQRFQIINYTPIYIENILVSQHFDMVELDPRSSIYNISYEVGS